MSTRYLNFGIPADTHEVKGLFDSSKRLESSLPPCALQCAGRSGRQIGQTALASFARKILHEKDANQASIRSLPNFNQKKCAAPRATSIKPSFQRCTKVLLVQVALRSDGCCWC